MQCAVVAVSVAAACIEGQEELRRYAVQVLLEGLAKGRIGLKRAIGKFRNFNVLRAEESGGGGELVDANP